MACEHSGEGLVWLIVVQTSAAICPSRLGMAEFGVVSCMEMKVYINVTANLDYGKFLISSNHTSC